MKPQLTSLIGKRVHFIGIGGAGMSGLARIALSHGITVSGSDAKDSSVVTALSALGATVSTIHSAKMLMVLILLCTPMQFQKPIQNAYVPRN